MKKIIATLTLLTYFVCACSQKTETASNNSTLPQTEQDAKKALVRVWKIDMTEMDKLFDERLAELEKEKDKKPAKYKQHKELVKKERELFAQTTLEIKTDGTTLRKIENKKEDKKGKWDLSKDLKQLSFIGDGKDKKTEVFDIIELSEKKLAITRTASDKKQNTVFIAK